MTKPERLPLIESITAAYHWANCGIRVSECPPDCPGRMKTGQAVAVMKAVRARVLEIVDKNL